jgi:hypothetical protein
MLKVGATGKRETDRYPVEETVKDFTDMAFGVHTRLRIMQLLL